MSAPVREVDLVVDWFYTSEDAEFAAVYPFKLKFKSLAFTADRLVSKFLSSQIRKTRGSQTLFPNQRSF